MSYQVFARKTRPRNFSEVVGQSHVLQALANGLDANRVHHAFLFTGTRGVGKTTIARIFSKALNCEKGVSANPCGECAHCVDIDAGRFVDLIEIDAASRTGVDDIRELIENVQYAPTRGRHKVYLIDEVHMLSNSAFNALLKTLEEPPEHVKFLLATTDPQKIPVTVLSRCLQFNLRRLSASEIKAHLAAVLDADGVSYESPALSLIARAADGSVRDSLSLLDQALNFGAGKLAEAETRAMLGTVDESRVVELLSTIISGDAPATFAQIENLQSFGFDWKASLSELASLCQRAAVCQQAPQALPEDTPALEAVKQFAAQLSAADIQLYYQIAVAGLRDMDLAPEPRAGFEMVMLRMLAFQPAQTASAPAPAEKKTPQTSPASIAAGNASPVNASPGNANPATPAVATAAATESETVNDESLAEELAAKTTVEANPAAPAKASATPKVEPAASSAPELETPAKAIEKPAEQAPMQEGSYVAEPSAAPEMHSATIDWAVFAAGLPLKGMLVALAENTAILQQTENQLVLGVSQEMATVCPDGVRQRLVEIVQQQLPALQVELQIMGDSHQAATHTPAAKAAKAEETRQEDAEASIERDPNVRQLLTEFDGQVEAESIKPVSA
jgi:DNA polymerase-3 subunit gamma/tau